MAKLNEMTAEYLGPDAAPEDLEQFKDWVRELMARDGYPEWEAIDALWGDGDYLRNAVELGLRPDVGPLE
jgi:phosphoribosylamine-glycine ligase